MGTGRLQRPDPHSRTRQANPPGSGWGRNTADLFFVGDVDGDGKDEIILVDKNDGWIGVLTWTGTALTYVNGSAPPVKGPGAANPPGSGWRIGPADNILLADCDNDGKNDVFLWNNNDLWVGLLRFTSEPISYVWGAEGTLTGPAGTWNRSGSDSFAAAVYRGQSAIGVTASFGRQGLLLFQNGELEVVAMTGSAPAPAWSTQNETANSITVSWTGPPPSPGNCWYSLSWEAPLQPPTNTDMLYANTYTMTGLTPGTDYTITLSYFTDGIESAVNRASITTRGVAPTPPLVVVPQLIGQTLTQAVAILQRTGLVEGSLLNESNELRTDYLKVIQQSPSAGTRVTQGSSVGVTVTAIPQTIAGFSRAAVTNENTDGRSVQVFLIDLVNSNPQNMGSLALNATLTLTLQDGHDYEIVVVDTGLDGCPGLDPANVSCQRSLSFANGSKSGPVLQIVVP